MEFRHTPVLLEQCIENLNIRPDGVYVDGTLGGAGHSRHICEKLSPTGTLIGIDRDRDALDTAEERLQEYNCRKIFVQSNYSDIKEVLAETGISGIDGALLDLGVSSFQLDNVQRGFSYMEYVVSKGGGGNAKITGYRIGGKTGTANKVANGKYSNDTWSSFVGMAPMDDPKLAILVIVDSPQGVQYGSATAAPIARTFLKNALTYLEISPSYTTSEKKALGSDTVYVPTVKGKSYSDAIGILGSAGLKYKVSPAISGNKDFTIVDQYPKAGKKASKGDTVYLYRK